MTQKNSNGRSTLVRSHMANEYIRVDEIAEGINIYIQLLKSLLFSRVNKPEQIFQLNP